MGQNQKNSESISTFIKDFILLRRSENNQWLIDKRTKKQYYLIKKIFEPKNKEFELIQEILTTRKQSSQQCPSSTVSLSCSFQQSHPSNICCDAFYLPKLLCSNIQQQFLCNNFKSICLLLEHPAKSLKDEIIQRIQYAYPLEEGQILMIIFSLVKALKQYEGIYGNGGSNCSLNQEKYYHRRDKEKICRNYREYISISEDNIYVENNGNIILSDCDWLTHLVSYVTTTDRISQHQQNQRHQQKPIKQNNHDPCQNGHRINKVYSSNTFISQNKQISDQLIMKQSLIKIGLLIIKIMRQFASSNLSSQRTSKRTSVTRQSHQNHQKQQKSVQYSDLLMTLIEKMMKQQFAGYNECLQYLNDFKNNQNCSKNTVNLMEDVLILNNNNKKNSDGYLDNDKENVRNSQKIIKSVTQKQASKNKHRRIYLNDMNQKSKHEPKNSNNRKEQRQNCQGITLEQKNNELISDISQIVENKYSEEDQAYLNNILLGPADSVILQQTANKFITKINTAITSNSTQTRITPNATNISNAGNQVIPEAQVLDNSYQTKNHHYSYFQPNNIVESFNFKYQNYQQPHQNHLDFINYHHQETAFTLCETANKSHETQNIQQQTATQQQITTNTLQEMTTNTLEQRANRPKQAANTLRLGVACQKKDIFERKAYEKLPEKYAFNMKMFILSQKNIILEESYQNQLSSLNSHRYQAGNHDHHRRKSSFLDSSLSISNYHLNQEHKDQGSHSIKDQNLNLLIRQ